MKKRLYALVNRLCLFIFGLALSVHTSAGTFPNRVSYIETGGASSEFSWFVNYDIQLLEPQQEILIELSIGLQGFNPSPALMDTWEEGIETNWSNRYGVLRSDGEIFGVEVDVSFFDYETADFGQIFFANAFVEVFDSAGAVTLTEWYTQPLSGQALVVAHEIGHMLGNYDEYIGGAVDPLDSTYWNIPDSIMGSGITVSVHERHYQFILDWAQSEFAATGNSFSLVPAEFIGAPTVRVPLPPLLPIFVLATFCYISRFVRSGSVAKQGQSRSTTTGI